jgi:hypothetical protein
MDNILQQIDTENAIPIKLYDDKCKLVVGENSSHSKFLTKDLSILKRPLESIVVLDVVQSDPR